jgi:hypothetical protein
MEHGFTWRNRKRNKELCGELTTSVLQERRLEFMHIRQILLWKPNQGARKRRRPAFTYVDQLKKDTGLTTEELKNIMDDCEEWRKLVKDVRARNNLT